MVRILSTSQNFAFVLICYNFFYSFSFTISFVDEDVPYPLDAPFGGGDHQYPLSSVGTMLSESPLFGSDGANLFSVRVMLVS